MKQKIKKAILCILCAGLVMMPMASYAAETDLVLNTADNSAEIEKTQYMCGQFYVPSLGINVRLFDVDGMDSTVIQNYANEEDTAVTYCQSAVYNYARIIGDHANQGFRALKDAVPFETTAYIQKGTVVESYICIASGTAIVKDGHIVDEETGESIYSMDFGYEVSFYTQTCRKTNLGGGYYYAVWFYCGSVDTAG